MQHGKYKSNFIIPANASLRALAREMPVLDCDNREWRISWRAFSRVEAIPHKERTAKRSGKRYNKEVKKQLTMSLISDELGQASTKKSSVIRKLIPSKRATSGTSATRSTSAWMRTADWFTRWKRQLLSYIEIGSKAHTRFHQKYGYKNFINIRTVMDEF